MGTIEYNDNTFTNYMRNKFSLFEIHNINYDEDDNNYQNNKFIKNMSLHLSVDTHINIYDIKFTNNLTNVNVISDLYNTPTVKFYSKHNNITNSKNENATILSEILEDIPKKFYYEWLSTNPISLEDFEEHIKYQTVYIYSRVGVYPELGKFVKGLKFEYKMEKCTLFHDNKPIKASFQYYGIDSIEVLLDDLDICLVCNGEIFGIEDRKNNEKIHKDCNVNIKY
jgi:hypothetical protein